MQDNTETATGDIGQIVRALERAPSVHGTRPWLLEPGPDSIRLIERLDVTVPAGDPDGRDHT
ncbi:MAG TPA: nitroreductase, partial [Pseudonocardiaceae bacterium]|nr:nitroreductase [Pseudonocardiaceae bacterium]